MIKSFLNGVIGGFSRTLGRILFYVLIALIFYFIFGLKNVDAAELNVNANVYSTMGNTYYQRMFTGLNYYGGSLSESNFSFGTTYSGKLKQIHFRVDRTFNYTNSYTLTLQSNSTDFRNYLDSVFIDDTTNFVQCTTISSQFISKSKISVTFVCPYQVNTLTFHFYAKENNYLTGDTNFNIKNVILEEHTSGQNSDDIINNNNENTQDIINNNNSNTQDIINNNNENTDKLNESIQNGLNYCYNNFLDKSKINKSGFSTLETGVRINYTGSNFLSSQPIYFNDIIKGLKNGVSYKFKITFSNCKRSRLDYYLDNSVIAVTDGYTFTYNSSTDYSQAYFYFPASNTSDGYCSITNFQLTESTNNISQYIYFGQPYCESRLTGIDQQLYGLDQTLTSQSPMDSTIFSTWWTNFTQNQFSNPLGNLITLPVNLVQKLINYSSSACQPVQLGSLLGTNLTLTCFTLGDIITNSVVLNVIDLIMSLSLIVFTLKKAYETVSNLISLGGENEVKKHFKFPTPMEFIASLFGGGN